jgi:hypothetical protein
MELRLELGRNSIRQVMWSIRIASDRFPFFVA